MKVLILSDRPFIGGGHKSGATVATQRVAQSLVNLGVEVDDYSCNYFGPHVDGVIKTVQRTKGDLIRHFDFYSLCCMIRFFFAAKINLIKRIKETIKIAEIGYLCHVCNSGYDVVHFNDYGFMHYYVLRRLKRKPIMTIHGFATGLEHLECSDPKYLDVYHEWERYEYLHYRDAIREKRWVTFVSSGLKAQVAKLMKTELPQEFVVIPNMIGDTIKMQENRMKVRETLHVPEKTRLLICAGTVSSRKNQTQLVKAMALQDKNFRKGVHVLIIGNDSQTDLRTMVKEYGVEECVHVIGFVPPQQMADYYEQADGVVVPSLYETFGMPIIEAYMYGLPVALACDLDAFEDTYDERGCVVIRDRSDEALADAICQLATKQWDSEVIKLLGNKFTMNVVGRQYMNYYQKYIKSN